MEQEPFVLRWGIVGTGLAASLFVSDLVRDPATNRNERSIKHVVQAIASSTSREKSQAFAQRYVSSARTAPALYNSYEKLYDDPQVDVVYIATPNALHMQNALDSIKAGKHVLVEKPLAVTAKHAEKIVAAAQQRGVFLMEAVWTRFFPLTLQLQKFIHEEKSIGRVTRVIVDFGLETPLKEQPVGSRVSNLPLGAGVLLDIGVYSLTWASLALNDPSHPEDTDVEVSSALSSNRGIDELATVVLNYPRKLAQAICTASYLAKSDPEFGRIEGEEGSIQIIGRTASKPSSLILRRKGEEAQRFDVGVDGMGFFYEADAVARCIRSGQRECEVMPLRESLRVMRLLDEVRRQNGMRYPQDDE